jgi:dTDP-4-amino-4,6-dideoxygalactose transaminase
MKNVMRLAEQYNCYVLEDASQSHGTVCEDGRLTGNIGHISAFSLYPGKNLGALGDAGIVTTNDKQLADNVAMLRNYGSQKKYYYDFKGYNNRMDSMQAIFLKQKLKHLNQWNKNRSLVADQYNKNITNSKVQKPEMASYCKFHTYHIYAVRAENRDDLMQHLNKNDVQCGIHYPIPIELTKPYSDYGRRFENINSREIAKQLVSLPMHPFMSKEDVQKVCQVVNAWQG